MRKRILLLLIPALFLLLTLCASADELILPAGLVTIEEEAFAGDLALDEVILPEGLVTIGAGAFAGSGITRIYLPESITSIAPDAFDQCPQLTGWGPDYSYASDYFDEHGLNFEHTPRHIALLIGNGDYNGDGDTDDSSDLTGPLYDINAFEQTLLGLNPAWEVTKKTNLTVSQFLSWIDTVFGDSRSCDICLLHYSGHCATNGRINCVDGNNVAAQDLSDRLNQAAKGKVIVQLDCCYSGALIAEDEASVAMKGRGTADPSAAFNAAVISAFSGYTLQSDPLTLNGITPKNGELRQKKFCVLTACTKDQISAELTSQNGYSYGLMTYELVRALGCSYPNGTYGGKFHGDTDEDSRLTLLEAKTCIADRVALRRTTRQNDLETNHDQYYEDWKSYWNTSKWFDGKYYGQYDAYFEARYNYYYHAYDQITSSYGDGSFVLYER